MFDDPKEELRRLQQRLLEEEDREEPDPDEDWLADAQEFLGDDPDDEEEEEPEEPPVRNYANGYGRARNRDRADLELEDYSEEVYRGPRKKGTGCLVTLLCLELLGIAALAAYWYLVLL